MTTTCPKCSYVRLATDDAPDWQCPSCGIAYHKYEKYLHSVKHIAAPVHAAVEKEPVAQDGSVWSLVAVNLFVLALAFMLDWQLIDMMLVYWIQSVIIGASYFFRILALDKFSTKNFRINNRAVEPTRETKVQTAFFFAFHYGFFHLGYFMFLLVGEYGRAEFGWDLMLGAIAFAINHGYSYRYHRDHDRQGTPNIGTMMFTPYVRIVPMHMIIVFGTTLSGIGKTLADAIMHVIEHNIIARRSEAE